MDGNFLSVTEATYLRNRTVLLFGDSDVATRGYTLAACSSRLKELGALRVDRLVLAQSVTTHREQVATSVTQVAEWIHLAEAMHVGPERFTLRDRTCLSWAASCLPGCRGGPFSAPHSQESAGQSR